MHLCFAWVVISSRIWIISADYLYMTCHDAPNIIAYDVNTTKLSTATLLDLSGVNWTSDDNLRFRGMAILYDILYVANSKKDASFVGKWRCNQTHTPKDGTNGDSDGLKFIANYTGLDNSNPGLVHPYGLRWYDDMYCYVTTQDTQSLLMYNWDGDPVQSAPANSIYPGSIVTYGPFNDDDKGVRDVALDHANNLLFVAHQTLQMVLCYDAANDFENIFNISYGSGKSEPIGLRINYALYPNMIFIGDNGEDAVYAFVYNKNLKTFKKLWKTKSMKEMSHPAGMDVNEKYLFVVDQDNNLILQFEPITGNYIKTFADFSKLKVTGENLIYVPGNGCSN
eukprot:118934_1